MKNLVSPLIIVNRLTNNYYFKIIKKIIYSEKDLIKITVKSENKKSLNSISPHSKRIARTKRQTNRRNSKINLTNKINKSTLNRILKAYPSYIRVLWMIKTRVPV